jgi:hypothetical protein
MTAAKLRHQRVPGLIKNYDTNFALGGPIKRDRLWFFGNARSFGSASDVPGLYGTRTPAIRTRSPTADTSLKARNAQLEDDRRDPLDRSAHAQEQAGLLLRLPEELRGSSFTQDGDQCRDRGDDWVALGAIGGFGSNSPEAGNQVWDDREKIVQARGRRPSPTSCSSRPACRRSTAAGASIPAPAPIRASSRSPS